MGWLIRAGSWCLDGFVGCSGFGGVGWIWGGVCVISVLVWFPVVLVLVCKWCGTYFGGVFVGGVVLICVLVVVGKWYFAVICGCARFLV